MYREPEEAPPKEVIKVDPTASLRSRIRRASTVRLHTHERDQSSASRRRSQQTPNPVVDRRALLNLINRDRENAAAASPNVASSGIDRDTDSADLARTEASNRRRFESGRALLRDVLSYERPGHRMRIPRESSLRYEMPPPPELEEINRPESGSATRDAHSVGGLSRSPPPDYMPTPSSDETTLRTRSPSGPAARNPSLTPRFAPAHRFDDVEQETRHHPSTSVLRPTSRSRNTVGDYSNPHSSTPGDSPQSPGWQPAYGSLVPRPRDHIDGLGDRRRSFSPEDENQWETLLTTITPDPRLPSATNSRLPSTASSSFTSEAASFPSSNSNSVTSSNTLLTAPSSTLNYPPTTVCDDLSDSWPDSSSSASDYDEPLAMHSSRHGIRHRMREETIAPSRHWGTSPPPRDLRRLDAIEETRRRAPRGENFYHENRRGIAEREAELQQMHAILARLDRQEEVPDEWWAAAGLTRVGQGIARAERGRL